MALIQIGQPQTSARVFKAVQHVVEVRAKWSGKWQRVPYLRCRKAVDCTAPAIGNAVFSWHFGNVKHEDMAAFQNFSALNVRDFFIRVSVLTNGGAVVYWTGIASAESMMPNGGTGGQQDFEAFGLCQLLDRDAIRSATVADDDGNFSQIDWVPRFNERYTRGVQVAGNRSAYYDDAGFVFGGDDLLWDNLQAAQYVLGRHTPANGPKFELGGVKDVLAKINGVHELEGRTPWSVLNELVSRNRGLVLAPVVNGDTVTLCVDSILEKPLACGSLVIPANSQPQNVTLDSFVEIDAPRITISTAMKFDKIEARGARILVCGTFAYKDDTLEEAWLVEGANGDQALYENGVYDKYGELAGQNGYHNPLTNAEKAVENDIYRKSQRFESVFCRFRAPATWDGKLGDGTGGTKCFVLPTCRDDGTVVFDGSGPLWLKDKAFESWLPFEEGKDYTVDPPAVTSQRGGAEPSYIRPFVLIQRPYWEIGGKNIYFHVDKMPDEYSRCNANFSIFPREMAIHVEPNPRHLFALPVDGHGFGATAAQPTNDEPQFDFGTMLATLAFRSDAVLRVLATRDGLKDSDMVRTLTIDIPDAEYWCAARDTVLDVGKAYGLRYIQNAGNPTAPIILRNDVDRLKQVVAFAKAWYCVDRASLTVPLRRIDQFVPLGALIQTAVMAGVQRAIGTVVTSKGWDFDNNRTTIQTQWAELDLSGGL